MASISLFLSASLLLGFALALPYERLDIKSSLIYGAADVAGKSFEFVSPMSHQMRHHN
jgi:hypothetical protein